ncbi:MAG: nucleotide sugar dehydrogenase [Pirellulales bacterium]|nr:nucleotide sugar dehydrogenase [Pirellulales bacterium]
MLDELLESIRTRRALIGVLGLGYVGLPLVRLFVGAGFRTLGFDVDEQKIARLRAGESYIGHIPGNWIADAVRSGRFEPTADPHRLAEPDALLICVPTPLADNRDPDLSFVERTSQQIAATLRPGQIVVLESTTYPGTTRSVVLPRLAAGGLTVERDFFLAYSPEREDPGNPNHRAEAIPKVVSGHGPASLAAATALYQSAIPQVVPVASLEVAEACKLLENTYRAVNIALVNELKVVFDSLGLDIWEVIDAARTKPFGFQAFYPGPGLGGHCIPIDPFYLSWVARQHGAESRFVELAGQINTEMPRCVVARVEQALRETGRSLAGSKVCLVGVAYKRDVDDPRESPAFVLLELLAERGVVLSYNDPFIPHLPAMRHHSPPPLASQPLSAEFLAAQDCLLVVTDHSQYDWQFIVDHARLVVDTRGATRHLQRGLEKVRRA